MEEHRYWQIAAGSDERDYWKEFLRYGLAFVGGDSNEKAIRNIQAGDRIVLKRGIGEIVAVGCAVKRDGIVAFAPDDAGGTGRQDKKWLNHFDGWQLPAYCNIEWHIPREPHTVDGLTRGTLKRLWVPDLLKLSERILSEVAPRTTYDTEPTPTKKVSDDEIRESLVRKGLRPALAVDLVATFSRIRMLANYYYNVVYWEEIREHEARSFLILPLLFALGWAEQQIKIEYPVHNRLRADIVCFSQPYVGGPQREADRKNCKLIIESKAFSKGLHYAPDQVKMYADSFPECQVVVVSNGFCYKMFCRGEDDTFPESASAYLNILDPQSRYPLDPERVDGCLKAFHLLMPSAK